MHCNSKSRSIKGSPARPGRNPARLDCSGKRRAAPTSDSGLRTSDSRAARGVALVVTLLMLSVITFLAITFLVLSHRERGAVSTTTDQTTATFTAQTALERAKVEIMARMIALTNDQSYDLIVSTNFINSAGFDPNASDYRTNVNYDHLVAGGPLTQREALRNLGNLLYDPRPPVYVFVNPLYPTNAEFRYYLDLNRNGRYDTNGFQPEIGFDGKAIIVSNTVVSNFYVGDPEWIGVLEHPDQPHSANNRFVARYAYIVLPAGKTLDVNYIHNQAYGASKVELNSPPDLNDDYFRNQGVGTWEMNLAAFLYDLNTNSYPLPSAAYNYSVLDSNFHVVNGNAFADAESIYRYRLNGPGGGSAMNLATARQLFPNLAVALARDNIDEYSDGPLMTGTAINESAVGAGIRDPISTPWVGADNAYHFFAPEEFFNPLETSGGPSAPQYGFTNRLMNAGMQADSYDRYTFYRMLAQLGTDSAPEQNKININYANLDANGNAVPGMETNLISWSDPNATTIYGRPGAEMFFNAAADRVLRTNTSIWLSSADTNGFRLTFGVTNVFGLTTNAAGVTGIPVLASWTDPLTHLTTNFFGYTPGVHHLLQVVANIYDANNNSNYPSVFRPIFRLSTGLGFTNVYIVGYRLETNTSIVQAGTAPIMVDLGDNNSVVKNILAVTVPWKTDSLEPLVYGVPFVIGAKKGLPNFNKFALENAVTASRTLGFHRPSNGAVDQTNQSYSLSVSNSFGVQAWNSYKTPYSGQLQMIVAGDIAMSLTNEFGTILGPNGLALTNDLTFAIVTNFTSWPGGFTTPSQPNPYSFIVPIVTNYFLLTNCAFVRDNNRFYNYATGDATNYFPNPHWWLYTRTRLRYILLDTKANRIIDYANLRAEASPLNILATLHGGNNIPCDGTFAIPKEPTGEFWCTNRTDGSLFDNALVPTLGMMNQINVSAGLSAVDDHTWEHYNLGGGTVNSQQGEVNKFLTRLFSTTGLTDPTDLNFQAPFTPTRSVFQYMDWQANDPLVHYTVPDLTDLLSVTNAQLDYDTSSPVYRLSGNSALATHYRPWGGNPRNSAETTILTKTNMLLKDPVRYPVNLGQWGSSDDWDFPTNKFPNVGWIGRVHRGSPWQTIYLKASDVPVVNYSMWSGTSNFLDAFYMSKPVNDRLLFDVFTAAINENATRGQLSVNQANLAAWSAALSGVVVLTNAQSGLTQSGSPFGPRIIGPAGIYNPLLALTNQPPIVQIWQGINSTRNNLLSTNGPIFTNQVFQHEGDILATPQLTEKSPFLFPNNIPSDEVVERIPQQIMGLLTLSHTPRFVIYAYGQTLHPADQSIYTESGAFFGLCTNYQVTAETATRAVVRVEGGLSNPHIVVEQYNVLPPD